DVCTDLEELDCSTDAFESTAEVLRGYCATGINEMLLYLKSCVLILELKILSDECKLFLDNADHYFRRTLRSDAVKLRFVDRNSSVVDSLKSVRGPLFGTMVHDLFRRLHNRDHVVGGVKNLTCIKRRVLAVE